MKHVNFDSNVLDENFRSVETIETTADIEKQPEHVSKVLKKFLKGTWDESEEPDDFLGDKILIEFPVFALNDDYLRALANVVFSKIDAVRNMISHKQREISQVEAERDRRDQSVSFQKSRREQREPSNERPRTPSAERRAIISKREQIDTWIAKQQMRKQQVVLLEHFAGLLQSLNKSSLASGFYTVLQRSQQLGQKESKIRERNEQVTRAKLFYKWFERYYKEVDKSMKVYYRSLKRRAFMQMNLNRRKMLIKYSKALQLNRQQLKQRAIRGWIYKVQEIKTRRRLGLDKQKLVEIKPIIDRDITQAYIPKDYQSESTKEPVFNVFATQNQLRPVMYHTGATNTIETNQRSSNHVSTLSRNYSPLRNKDRDPGKDEEYSFTWKLVKNQNSTSMGTLNRSNALCSAVGDKNTSYYPRADTTMPISTIQNKSSEGGSLKAGT